MSTKVYKNKRYVVIWIYGNHYDLPNNMNVKYVMKTDLTKTFQYISSLVSGFSVVKHNKWVVGDVENDIIFYQAFVRLLQGNIFRIPTIMYPSYKYMAIRLVGSNAELKQVTNAIRNKIKDHIGIRIDKRGDGIDTYEILP